ncbi:3-oxoacyl-[acyl-carrier-protein] reductase FabG [compost metagenome]
MLLKSCMSKKVSNNGSSFVIISSIAGFVGSPGNSIYGASKAALNSIIKSSAREMSPRIRVNGIAPGVVSTPLTDTMPEEYNQRLLQNHPLGIGEPEDVAYAAAYLLSNASKWVTGTILMVDGGYSS